MQDIGQAGKPRRKRRIRRRVDSSEEPENATPEPPQQVPHQEALSGPQQKEPSRETSLEPQQEVLSQEAPADGAPHRKPWFVQ